jgi:hypothetical protein
MAGQQGKGHRNLVWWVISYTVLGETWYLVDRTPYYAQLKLRNAYTKWHDKWEPLPLWRAAGVDRREIHCIGVAGPFVDRREAEDHCLAYTFRKLLGVTEGLELKRDNG